MSHVLVVEDEPEIRAALVTNLRQVGHRVAASGTAREALHLAAADHPDLVLLDLGLPDQDGVEVIRSLRTWTDTPIIILSLRNAEADKVEALDAGADDYVSKPFGVDELLARVRAALRRHQPVVEEPVVRTAAFTVDLERTTVSRADGTPVHLTPIEWGLLAELVRQPGRLVPQRTLLQAVWGPQYERETHYLRVHLAAIRRKLEPEPSLPCYFVTEAGLGYRFVPDAQ
jgi:two-component system, OmpR family, KDP operon response regulator KdpE